LNLQQHILTVLEHVEKLQRDATDEIWLLQNGDPATRRMYVQFRDAGGCTAADFRAWIQNRAPGRGPVIRKKHLRLVASRPKRIVPARSYRGDGPRAA
jgi:hypothetical protein